MLTLGWTPGALIPATGVVHVAGATPFQTGLLGVSTGTSSFSALGVEFLLDFSPGAWFALPLTFDAGGGTTIGLDLRTPGLRRAFGRDAGPRRRRERAAGFPRLERRDPPLRRLTRLASRASAAAARC